MPAPAPVIEEEPVTEETPVGEPSAGETTEEPADTTSGA